MDYKTLTGDKKIHSLQKELGSRTWPEFMQHDKTVEKYWPDLYDAFLHLQFALFDQEVLVGVGNSVFLNWAEPISELPDTGLDWAMQKANRDQREGLKPNLQIGVQILINPNYQSKGISYKMLDIMKDIARANDIKRIALPVRPTLKSDYPLTEMEKYMAWQNKEGLAFDPWIRVHTKAGGRIVNICHKSMSIEGRVADWEDWTGKVFPKSGEYIVEKALVPVQIKKETDKGMYIEPNVWIIHDLSNKLLNPWHTGN